MHDSGVKKNVPESKKTLDKSSGKCYNGLAFKKDLGILLPRYLFCGVLSAGENQQFVSGGWDVRAKMRQIKLGRAVWRVFLFFETFRYPIVLHYFRLSSSFS